MRWLVLALLAPFSAPASALAFQIRTLVSEPCHETITLAAFGERGAPFGDPDESAGAVLEALFARAVGVGLPTDRASKGFVKDVAHNYALGTDDPVERWVLASLVAGSRDPDTRGFAIVSFNEARETHIGDEFQAPHSLRKASDDGMEGNEGAIAGARAELVSVMLDAHSSWWDDAPFEARWTFSFYGEQRVNVFGPAFHLGKMAHTTQDAFTHTLRDDELRIVTVLNFVDATLGTLKEGRDGLNHSDRLDECDLGGSSAGSVFDQLRVDAARSATVALVHAAAMTFESEGSPGASHIDPVLDEIYAYRPGCDVENDYCGSSWLEPARDGLTEPIRAWFCASSDGGSPGWWLVALAALGLSRRRYRRRRSSRAPSPV